MCVMTPNVIPELVSNRAAASIPPSSPFSAATRSTNDVINNEATNMTDHEVSMMTSR